MTSAPKAKFDETVDIAINLGVDPKHADQMVRGAIVLPNGVGRSTRVLVFAKGDKEAEAREAGADHVGGDIGQEDPGRGLVRVRRNRDPRHDGRRRSARSGPRSARSDAEPEARNGDPTGDAVRDQKAGKVEYRVDKAGIVHCGIGKVSFEAEKLWENASALIDVVLKAKPASTKGTYLKKISVSSTMGPGCDQSPLKTA